MSKGITRREALVQMGAVAGAAMVAPKLAGCGGSGKITTIVVVMMENRSYDHYLGARKLEGLGGDGLETTMGNLDLAGAPHAVYHEDVNCVADPPHGWTSSHSQFNAGANDGFVKAYQASQGEDIPPYVMGYFNRTELPVTWALADAYTTCDRWFCSVMGPTWPNRFYLHAAQSGGKQSNVFPDQTLTTIYDRLDAKQVPWTYYYTDLPFLAIMKIPATRYKPIDAFYSDAQMGLLPPVTIVEPGFVLNDDHPPHYPLLGQQFIASVYNALATSPQWEQSLLVVTYDEHGGFFDHVAPPKAADERTAAGFDQLGFRVPTLLAGPYVKRNYVSSVTHDHTSVLKHIETMFDLEPLTLRDAAANDLSDAIDQDRLASGAADAPVQLPVVMVDPETVDPACMGGGLGTDIELAADAGLIAPELDRRRYNRDTVYLIAEQLAKRGLGGIR